VKDGRECSSCGAENPATARFCIGCGASMARSCSRCGEAAPPEARFCPGCGAELSGGGGVATAAVPKSLQGPDERRRVTIVFADLSGFTAASEQMDPEAVKSLVDKCLLRLAEEVVAVGGVIDKYIGDSVMGLLGAPVAHEDDAERAVRAALAMQLAMPQLNADLGTDFELRVGVNTGEVMAGAVGDSYTVIGDPVNVAARLQSAGRPGSVTVGEQTWLATREAIEYVPLSPLSLKGKSEPVAAWEAVRALARRAAQAAREGQDSPLVGRSQELDLLTSQFERVEREGRPHLATVIGEAGVGKSRLLNELVDLLGRGPSPPGVRIGHCLPYGTGIVYWALGEIVRTECEITNEDDSDAAWGKLVAAAERLLVADDGGGESAERRAALVARLIGLDTPLDAALTVDEDPEQLRAASFSAVRALLEAMARERPLLLVVEDIHWADSGLLDLIEYIAQWVRGGLLIVCLAREELLDRRAKWGGGRLNASTIVLEPLASGDTAELVEALLEGSELDGGLVRAVAERSGGNPFFAEEIVLGLREQDAGASLPESIQAVLAARLDSLESLERQVVQQAAVVGRTFWLGSLEEIAAPAQLESALAALQEKELIVASSGAQLSGEEEYAFRHVLIRDVAYAQLPKSVRYRRHREVAEFIERRVGDRRDEVVMVLAEHYERAATLGAEIGLDAAERTPVEAQAIAQLEAAGDAAAVVFSNEEALRRYELAAGFVERIDDTEAQARLALKQGDLSMRLGRIDTAIELWEPALEQRLGASDLPGAADLHRRLGAAFWDKGETRQAIEHCQQGINLLKDTAPDLALVGLYVEAATLYMNTGDNMLAIYAAEKALSVAERLAEPRAAARAHGIFGRIFGRVGDLARANQNLNRSVELARETDPAETIRALLILGSHLELAEADGEAAAAAYSEALGLAERLGDAPAQAELHSALGVLAAYRADWDAVEEHADASAEIAEREGLAAKLAHPYALRGFLLWRGGDIEAAKTEFLRSHALAERVGSSEVAFSALLGLAISGRDAGNPGDTLEALGRALEVCERAGLGAQAVQALALRAITLALSGRANEGRLAAEEAEDRAKGLAYPIATAAVAEARGATAEDLAEGIALLDEAGQQWAALARPLDAARCQAVIARRLAAARADGAADAFVEATRAYAEAGVRWVGAEQAAGA